MKTICILTFFSIVSVFTARSQFMIIPDQVTPSLVTHQSLTSVTIFNSSVEVNAGLRVIIYEGNGNPVLTLITQPFPISNGSNTVDASTYGFISVNYGPGNKAQYLQLNQRLVSGEYQICYALVDNQGEGFSEVCNFMDASIFSNLMLVYPFDQDTISNLSPVLIWNHTEEFSALGENESFELKLSKVESQQTPVEAISQNIPNLLIQPILTHQVSYPIDAIPLEYNEQYAWQVTKYSDASVIQQTEVWTFYTYLDSLPKDKMYARLKEKKDAGYFNVDDHILYFIYDDHYDHITGDKLSYKILNYKNEVVFSHNHNLNEEPLVHLGKNKFSFNLNEMALPEGDYTLQIKGSTIKYYLQFRTN